MRFIPVTYSLLSFRSCEPYLGLLFEWGVDSPLATFSNGLSTQFGNSGILCGLNKLSALKSKSVYTLLGCSRLLYPSSSLEQDEDSTTILCAGWSYSSSSSCGQIFVGGMFSTYNMKQWLRGIS